ncbi:MAG: 30S ribosomal protein S17 [Desulfurococcales archaeon]|nr:30S ribosomal protein S17 [Desulfurococcales archaeon]
MSGVSVRNVGIKYPGLRPPEKTCDDPFCPWHGHIKVRGGLLEGKIIKARMRNTVVVEREYLVYVKKYMRYERRRSRIHAHLPPCIDASVGDIVLIGETRPIAKSVSWVVLGVIKKGVSEGA